MQSSEVQFNDCFTVGLCDTLSNNDWLSFTVLLNSKIVNFLCNKHKIFPFPQILLQLDILPEISFCNIQQDKFIWCANDVGGVNAFGHLSLFIYSFGLSSSYQIDVRPLLPSFDPAHTYNMPNTPFGHSLRHLTKHADYLESLLDAA